METAAATAYPSTGRPPLQPKKRASFLKMAPSHLKFPKGTPLPSDSDLEGEGNKPCICAKKGNKGTYKQSYDIKKKDQCGIIVGPNTKLCNEKLKDYTDGSHIALSIKTTSKSEIIKLLGKISSEKQLGRIVQLVSEKKRDSISKINKEKDLQLEMKKKHLAPDIVSVVVFSTVHFKYDAILDALAQAVYDLHKEEITPTKLIWLNLIRMMVPSGNAEDVYTSMMEGRYKSIPYTTTTWLERPFNITADSLRAIGIDADHVEEIVLIMERCGEASGITADGIIKLTRKLVEMGILAIDYKLDNTCNTITALPSEEEPDPLPVRLVDFGIGFFPDPNIVQLVNQDYGVNAPDLMFKSMMLIFIMETFWQYNTAQFDVEKAQSDVERAESELERAKAESELEIERAESELERANSELEKAKAKEKVYKDLLIGLKMNESGEFFLELISDTDKIIDYIELYEDKEDLEFTPLFLLVHYTYYKKPGMYSYLGHEVEYKKIREQHIELIDEILDKIFRMRGGGSKRKTRRRIKKRGKKGKTRRR